MIRTSLPAPGRLQVEPEITVLGKGNGHLQIMHPIKPLWLENLRNSILKDVVLFIDEEKAILYEGD